MVVGPEPERPLSFLIGQAFRSLGLLIRQAFRLHGWKGLAAVFVAVPLGLTLSCLPNSLPARYIERWLDRHLSNKERERSRNL